MIQTIAIVGAGAIGSFYGAKLSQAGLHVSLLLRSNLDAIRRHGLTLLANGTSTNIPAAQLHPAGTPTDIGPSDLVIITLKTTGNSTLRQTLQPLLKKNTLVLTLQNGIGNEDLLEKILPSNTAILGGTCYIAVSRSAPDTLDCCQTPGAITLAEHRGPAQSRTHELATLLSNAGIPTRASDSLDDIRWKKLIWNIPFNGLSIILNLTSDLIASHPQHSQTALALMREIAAIATTLGVNIPDSFIENQLTRTRALTAYKPSTYIDYLAGRELELDAIWLRPLQVARQNHIPAPHLESLCHSLSQLAPKT